MPIAFTTVQPLTAMAAVRDLPGVMRAEPVRTIAAEFRAGWRTHRGAAEGLAADGVLLAVRDVALGPVGVTRAGLVIGDELARILDVAAGDRVEVALLEGHRHRLLLDVATVVTTYIGTPAYLELRRLNTLAGDGDVVSGARLIADAAVSSRTAARASFDGTLAETIHVIVGFHVGFHVGFAGLVAFGVVYASARITLSERGRELAPLRVLGFTRGEIGYSLAAELGLLALLSLPAGTALGHGLAGVLGALFANELYRVPFVVAPAMVGVAIVTVLAATALAIHAVHRRLERLELLAVLKTRE